MKKIVSIIVIAIILIILCCVGLYRLLYFLSGETTPNGWKTVQLEEGCDIKIPTTYHIKTINKKKQLIKHKFLFMEGNKTRYIGRFFIFDDYMSTSKISFEVNDYLVSFFNDEDKQEWLDGGNYSNSGSWFETYLFINNKKIKTHLVEIFGDFGKKKEDLVLVLINIDETKANKYTTDNITRNIFSGS